MVKNKIAKKELATKLSAALAASISEIDPLIAEKLKKTLANSAKKLASKVQTTSKKILKDKAKLEKHLAKSAKKAVKKPVIAKTTK
jgi:hypothetical protein